MHFSSPIMLWKMLFFGIWTINVPEVIFYNGSDINRFMGFVFNFEVERCLNSFLCLIQKPFFARRTTPLIRLIESRKMLITPFQNIFVLFHFQSEFNYNVKVDEKHTIEVVFLVSIQLIAALEIGLTFLYFHLSQMSRNNSKVSYNWSLIYFIVNVYHCKIWQR